MVGYWCECDKCGGRLIGKTTWYAHNDKRRRRIQRHRRAPGTSNGTRRNPSQNAAPSPLGDFDVMKELSPEDPEDEESQDKIKRAARSDSVSAIR